MQKLPRAAHRGDCGSWRRKHSNQLEIRRHFTAKATPQTETRKPAAAGRVQGDIFQAGESAYVPWM